MKNLKMSLLAVLFLAALPVVAGADFSVTLSYGSSLKAEVLKLQEFLVAEGFLKVAPTGNFLSLTQDAVIAFQKQQGIDPIGIFGPLTRAAANKKLAGSATIKTGIVHQKVSPANSGASAIMAGAKKIEWQTKQYPANVGVDINLLRQKSASPASYELVRQIAVNTSNDGEELWIPLANENTADLYIEVACSTTHTFVEGCSISQAPSKI